MAEILGFPSAPIAAARGATAPQSPLGAVRDRLALEIVRTEAMGTALRVAAIWLGLVDAVLLMRSEEGCASDPPPGAA